MFRLTARVFARVAGMKPVDGSAGLSCSNTPFGRRHCAMIAPQLWRRRGPIRNLHDRLGTVIAGTRRGKPRTSRNGLTFWHRPYRSAV
jgi:hypothetical protein